jgi:hypothetical protein
MALVSVKYVRVPMLRLVAIVAWEGGYPPMAPSMQESGWGIGIDNKVLFDRHLSLS